MNFFFIYIDFCSRKYLVHNVMLKNMGCHLKKLKKLKKALSLLILYTLLIFSNDMMWCSVVNYKTKKLVLKNMFSFNKRKVKRTSRCYNTNECTYETIIKTTMADK